jgi:hypothetical protein
LRSKLTDVCFENSSIFNLNLDWTFNKSRGLKKKQRKINSSNCIWHFADFPSLKFNFLFPSCYFTRTLINNEKQFENKIFRSSLIVCGIKENIE